MNAERRNEQPGFRDAEVPTPPVGLPIADDTLSTPPSGINMSSGVVGPDDFGTPSPAVLGGEDPATGEQDEAGDWPTLEYRSRNKPEGGSGALGWIRRRRGTGE